MDLSAANLWAGFVAHCGERAPSAELMLEYAQEVAAYGIPGMLELRVGTIVAILRTRLACNRHFASLQDAPPPVQPSVRAHRIRSALTLAHLSKEIVDSANE